ncbi:MAG: hypothetical protein WC241_03725 [Candidatus Paceibacterota bacterium]
MKKIIVGIFSFALLFVAQSAFASTWNGASNDCRGISIVNATTNEGYAHPCWPSSSVSADAGDTLNVRVYYHNTGTATANNTTVTLNAPIGGSASSSKSFSGNISSDQGSLSLSTVTANLSSSQTITFNSVKWYTNNTSETLTALPYGQSGAEILSGGLNLGSIAPGWATQGSLVVSFHVSNTTAPQTCQDSSADNYLISYPCTYTPVVSTYTITATAGTGGTISPSGITSYPKNDSKWFTITPSNGYHALDVLVDDVSKGPNYGGYAFYNIVANHTIRATFAPDQVIAKDCIATLSASRPTITAGESSLLSWTLADCTNATIYPTIDKIYSSGSQNVYPTSSMLYTLTASGANGVVTKTVTINVNPPTQYCQDYNANNYGKVSPCTYNTVIKCLDTSANNYGSVGACTYTAVIKCQDYNANNYGSTGLCTYTKVENTVLSVISSINNSVNNSNNNNSVNNSNNTTITNQAPVQQICQDHSANNYLSSGSCTYTNYNRTRCFDTSASNYLDYNSCIYNQIRCLDTSASNYLAYSSCIYNQVRCLDTTASNYLAYNTCIYNTYVNKNVVTTVATNITKNEAQINGYITNSTYYNANVYFNYGTTVNLGSRTNSKVASGNSYFNDYLTGLAPNTIYFFQAVGESNTGVAKGSIEVFRTLGEAAVAKQIIVQGTTIVGKASPVQLNISNKYQLISAGDTVDYIVTYKNIGNTKLVKPMVQVVIPMNMTLINSSRGTYSVDTHTLSAPVEDLNPGQEGIIYLQAKVDSIPLNNSQIVTTALLVYTNTNGTQENAMAYVFNEPSAVSGAVAGDSSTLGASAFFGGLLSIGLIGWLLILLLVLIIILISRSYSRTSSETVTHTTTTH